EVPGQRFGDEVRSTLQVTDNLRRRYRLRPMNWGDSPGEPGRRRWRGEVLVEPQPAGPATGDTMRWLEVAVAGSQPGRLALPAPGPAETGPADPPWPTPAEAYLAELASVGSMSIATGEDRVELDTAKIVAAVADALLWTGALAPDSAVLSERPVPFGWQEELAHLWARRGGRRGAGAQTPQGRPRGRARDNEPERAGLPVTLPLRRATAVIESIAAQDEFVAIELYGHPWITGEYWPMIAPSFGVRATDDTGAEHQGMPGSGGGSPEGSREFWFWPPVPPGAKR